MERFDESALWLLFRKYYGDDLIFFFFVGEDRRGKRVLVSIRRDDGIG
jgi:hypothetical protein